MNTTTPEIDERPNLAGNSLFELLLLRFGKARGTDRRELFGSNVFKMEKCP